jgi:fatty-acyl-CoA synthase
MNFEELSIGQVLKEVTDKYKNKTAIVFDDESITFEEFYNASNLIASNLWKKGIRKNDKVAVILPNCLEYFYLYYALFIIGAWIVPVSTRYEKEEIKRILLDSDAKTVIYKNKIGVFDYDNILNEIKSDLPCLKSFISTTKSENSESLSDLVKENEEFDMFLESLKENSVKSNDVAILGYTSGTTGKPKGVMILHGNLVKTSLYEGKIMNLSEDAGFSIAPMYAAQGFNAILIYLISGITMKWISTFNPTDIITHIVKKEVSAFHTQPTMWSLVLSLPYFKYVRLKKLEKVIVSGSLCTPNLAKRIEKSTGTRLINVYGLIEATGVVTSTRLEDSEDIRLNTVGRAIEGVEIKIVDEKRQEVKHGEVGELAVKGYLMGGYYKKENETRNVIDKDGWLYTGDLAKYYKETQNIAIVGRKKDMIIRGGFNVYPVDIEECALEFDKIIDISVVGKEHEILGECIVAFVIPKPGVDLKESEVLSFCRGKISNYKIPDEVIFVSQFPILDSGKVKKNVLKKWADSKVPRNYKLD